MARVGEPPARPYNILIILGISSMLHFSHYLLGTTSVFSVVNKNLRRIR